MQQQQAMVVFYPIYAPVCPASRRGSAGRASKAQAWESAPRVRGAAESQTSTCQQCGARCACSGGDVDPMDGKWYCDSCWKQLELEEEGEAVDDTTESEGVPTEEAALEKDLDESASTCSGELSISDAQSQALELAETGSTCASSAGEAAPASPVDASIVGEAEADEGAFSSDDATELSETEPLCETSKNTEDDCGPPVSRSSSAGTAVKTKAKKAREMKSLPICSECNQPHAESEGVDPFDGDGGWYCNECWAQSWGQFEE